MKQKQKWKERKGVLSRLVKVRSEFLVFEQDQTIKNLKIFYL